MEVRYSFTAQFIRGGAIFANHAHNIEGNSLTKSDEASEAEHRSYVVSTVIQCAAALESEVAEILLHGPGHHLGSNGLDVSARDFLQPLAELIDQEPTLHRYELILHLLRRPALNRGGSPFQSADLLIKLRNELVHYKSKWQEEMERQKLFARLKQLRFQKPPFITEDTSFFPHKCLSASLASWSVNTAVAFITEFYVRLGIENPIKDYAERIEVPVPIDC
jgi:hypothetical protein